MWNIAIQPTVRCYNPAPRGKSLWNRIICIVGAGAKAAKCWTQWKNILWKCLSNYHLQHTDHSVQETLCCLYSMRGALRYSWRRHQNGNIFRITGPLCGQLTGQRWLHLTKASDAELWCILWSAPWINSWVNNRGAGDLRRHRAHYDVIVMIFKTLKDWSNDQLITWLTDVYIRFLGLLLPTYINTNPNMYNKLHPF